MKKAEIWYNIKSEKANNIMPDIFEYLRYTANLIAESGFRNQIISKGGSVLLS